MCLLETVVIILIGFDVAAAESCTGADQNQTEKRLFFYLKPESKSKKFEIGISVSDLNLTSLPSISLIGEEPVRGIKTLNKMGFATRALVGISEEFVQFSSKVKKPVFDGGAAFGISSVLALKTGATVITNDIDTDHLIYLAKNTDLNDEEKTRLFLKEGKIPNEVDFPENSLSAVHLSRMTQFLHPEEVESLFQKSKFWLENEGRIFINTATPYNQHMTGYIGIYESEYQKGNEWPGVFDDFTKSTGTVYAGLTQEFIHLYDPRILIRVASKYGFIVKKLELFGGPNDLDYMGVILINRK